MIRRRPLGVAVPVLVVCTSLASRLPAASARPEVTRNVLMVVLDDVGVDHLRAFGLDASPAPTPTLDGLIAGGVLFDSCWSAPLCSPARATLLTGRYGFRTGIGDNVDQDDPGLDLAEWTLPEVLAVGSGGARRTAAIGKWHLEPGSSVGEPPPVRAGFELSSGALGNLGGEGQEWVWWDFVKTTPGGKKPVKRYATTDEVEDARRAIEAFGADPWFVYLAFHAAHDPYHAPPSELQDRPLAGDPEDSRPLHHEAAVQALDSELGRLLAALPGEVRERTTIVLLGDNGTATGAIEPALDAAHCKGTLFEGGVHVPLVVAGAGLADAARGRRCAGLVNTTDLFATVAELCGIDARAVVPPEVALDAVSLVPYLADPGRPSLRAALYAERFRINPHGHYTKHVRAVRGARFKLIRDELTGTDLLFDLALDPLERRELLAADGGLGEAERRAYLDLVRWLEVLVP